RLVRRPLPPLVAALVAWVWWRTDAGSLLHAAGRVALLGLPLWALASLWRWRLPRSFETVVAGPWRSWRHKRTVYRSRWATVMTANGLTVKLGDVTHVPGLR